MPIVHHKDVAAETFPGGASYQTIVGDAEGSTPFRLGVQTCPPGYTTSVHYHPYLEAVTVLDGYGEVWMEGIEGHVPMQPGMTLVFPANVRHQFRAVGSLRIMGVHASPHRIVIVDDTRQSGLSQRT